MISGPVCNHNGTSAAIARFFELAALFRDIADSPYPYQVEEAAELIGNAFANGSKLLVFGNGGSAADAQHLAGELVIRFQSPRRALPAIALPADGAVLTACANDFSFADVFARQIEAFGSSGDVALGISTSGKSPNVLRALEKAKAFGLTTILFTGASCPLAPAPCDLVLSAPATQTARIQEIHLASYHLICEFIDQRFQETTE